MGRIGEIIEVLDGGLRVRVNLGSGHIVTADWSTVPGDDTRPLPGDKVYAGALPGSGRWVVVAGIDPQDGLEAGAGERRMYSRGSGGALAAAVWIKADGSVVITTGAGDAVLAADGSVALPNGAQITAAGDVVSATGISLGTHTHISAAPGSPTGPPQ